MFRHKGKTRTYLHNLQIASLLSFVAGIVNVAGYFSVQELTTNVTGHFAFFVDEIYKQNYWKGFHYFLYILFFFLGSFFSGFLIELIGKFNDRYIYRIPVIIEILILVCVALIGKQYSLIAPNYIAYALLFAMGLQNSLVTKISKSTVRTTHLTGLFTDLGIELAILFFCKEKEQLKKIISSVKLRLTIISFFFLGVLLGATFYSKINLYVLVLAAGILLFGLVWDEIKIQLKLNRKL